MPLRYKQRPKNDKSHKQIHRANHPKPWMPSSVAVYFFTQTLYCFYCEKREQENRKQIALDGIVHERPETNHTAECANLFQQPDNGE
jgi:hypothetical protein